jgi:hypothetical protein
VQARAIKCLARVFAFTVLKRQQPPAGRDPSRRRRANSSTDQGGGKRGDIAQPFCGVRSSQPKGICNGLTYRYSAGQHGVDVSALNTMSPRPSGLTAFFFNFDPQQPDNILFLEDDASAAELSDDNCAFRFHCAAANAQT